MTQSLVSYDFVGFAVWILTTVISAWDSELPWLEHPPSSLLDGIRLDSPSGISFPVKFESGSSSRVKFTMPLSFSVLVIDGMLILPVWICCFRTFAPASPRISPCSSFRGNNRARQQERDHLGFFCHSFKQQYMYIMYWTEKTK